MTTASTPPDPTSPASPTPPPAPSPDRSQQLHQTTRGLLEAEPPGFQTPPPPRAAQDPPSPQGARTRDLEDGEVASPAGPNDGGPRSSTTATTSPIGPSQVFTADPAVFESLFTSAVGVAGTLIDDRLSPQTHVWMPRPEEAQAIAEPLARIAARHTPEVGGQETSDILDGLEAGVAAVGYGMRAHLDGRRIKAAADEAAIAGQLGP